MKKAVSLFILVFIALGLEAQTLSWDIKFLKGRPGESIPINQVIRMESGENFQVYINPASDCFCYVVCYDSERQIAVHYNGPLKGGIEKYIGNFAIDDQFKTETLYIIMSLARRPTLENLIRNYINNQKSRQHANNLFREVSRLQNEASSLGEPSSVFIPTGGTTRSGTSKSEAYSTRFSDKNLYVRPITIRH